MNKHVFNAASLYVTNRTKFNKQYARNELARELMHEIFLESESRPDLAERIAIALLGHIPSPTKRGYDGKTKSGRPVEAKVRCFISVDGKFENCTRLAFNDISRGIVDRYIADQPLFVFPFFYDGHLAAIFTTEFKNIHKFYEARLASDKGGRCCFNLAAKYWANDAKVAFVNNDESIVKMLPKPLYDKVVG